MSGLWKPATGSTGLLPYVRRCQTRNTSRDCQQCHFHVPDGRISRCGLSGHIDDEKHCQEHPPHPAWALEYTVQGQLLHLPQELDSLREELELKTNSNQELRDGVSTLQADLEAWKDSHLILEGHVAELEFQVAAADASARATEAAATTAAVAADTAALAASDTVSELQSTIQRAEQQIQTYGTDMSSLRSGNHSLTMAAATASATTDRLELELQGVKQMQKTAAEFMADLEESNHTLSDLTNSLREELDTTKTSKQKSQANVTKLKEDLEALKERNCTLQAQLATYTLDAGNTASDSSGWEKMYKEAVEASAAQAAIAAEADASAALAANAAAAEAKTMKKAALAKIAELESALKLAIQQVQTAVTDVCCHQSEVHILTMEAGAALEKTTGLEVELKGAKQQQATAAAILAALKEENQNSLNMVYSLCTELATTTASNEGSLANVANLTKDLEGWQVKCHTLEAQVAALARDAGTQVADIAEKESKYATAKEAAHSAAVAAATAVVTTATKISSEQQSTIMLAKQQAQTSKTDESHFKAEIHRLTMAVGTATASIKMLELKLEDTKQRDDIAAATIAVLEENNKKSLNRANVAETELDSAREAEEASMEQERAAQEEIHRLRTDAQLSLEQTNGTDHTLKHISFQLATLKLAQQGNTLRLQESAAEIVRGQLASDRATVKAEKVEARLNSKLQSATKVIRDLEDEVERLHQISNPEAASLLLQAEADADCIAALVAERDDTKLQVSLLAKRVSMVEGRAQQAVQNADTLASRIGLNSFVKLPEARWVNSPRQQPEAYCTDWEEDSVLEGYGSASMLSEMDDVFDRISQKIRPIGLQDYAQEDKLVVQQVRALQDESKALQQVFLEITRAAGQWSDVLSTQFQYAAQDCRAVLLRRSADRSSGGW